MISNLWPVTLAESGGGAEGRPEQQERSPEEWSAERPLEVREEEKLVGEERAREEALKALEEQQRTHQVQDLLIAHTLCLLFINIYLHMYFLSINISTYVFSIYKYIYFLSINISTYVFSIYKYIYICIFYL